MWEMVKIRTGFEPLYNKARQSVVQSQTRVELFSSHKSLILSLISSFIPNPAIPNNYNGKGPDYTMAPVTLCRYHIVAFWFSCSHSRLCPAVILSAAPWFFSRTLQLYWDPTTAPSQICFAFVLWNNRKTRFRSVIYRIGMITLCGRVASWFSCHLHKSHSQRLLLFDFMFWICEAS